MFNDEDLESRPISATLSIILIIVMLLGMIFLFSSFTHAGEERKWTSHRIEVIATAYCLCEKCCNKKVHDGKTATGSNAYKPGIAVDPKIISPGSMIDCAEYTRKPTWCLADDRSAPLEEGGKIIGNRIDLRMTNHQEALNFGTKKVNIRIWTKE
jgi:3D (Asp-Asp-Asp) domain-containing protein